MDKLDFIDYLNFSGLHKASISTYSYQVNIFLRIYPDAGSFRYKDILNVMDEMTTSRPNVAYRQTILAAIKKYYDYLIYTGQREDHPCKKLNIRRLRDKKIIQQDLFSSQELALLMNREERYEDLIWKNKLIMSLLIYQGLSSGEISSLKMSHINLDEGIIYIKGSIKTAGRHLQMHATQYRIFDRYISESRNKLLRAQSDKLLIGKLGLAITTGEISYLVEQFKPLFPDRKLNPKSIRKSVISNWVNEMKIDIELAQLMAGHRQLSTTMNYRVVNTDELRSMINRFHPLV